MWNVSTEPKECAKELLGRIVRIRWVKPYAQAHNHVAVGEVRRETNNYLTLYCRTFHFGTKIGDVRGNKSRLSVDEEVSGIIEGKLMIRSIPWSRIEVITELPEDTDWQVPAEVDGTGLCQLLNQHQTMISRSQDIQQM